jgi:Skp family chaperone for outer membrane proteins
MTHFQFPFLAALALMISSPVTARAQVSEHAPHSPNTVHCSNDDDRHECAISNAERRRLAAETHMLNMQARRMQAETQMLNAQRSLAREERRRIQTERQAALSAAKQREWSHRRADVKVDQLKAHLTRAHTIVLTGVTGIDAKETVEQTHQILSGSGGLDFINPLKIKRKYRTHKQLPAGFIQRPGVLQAHIHREVLNEHGRFVRLVVKDHTGAVVYDARYENVHFGEMLAPLQGVTAL